MNYNFSTTELLKWYQDAGVDETISDEAASKFAALDIPETAKENQILTPVIEKKVILPKTETFAATTESAIKTATELANSANNLSELETALKNFNGCGLKLTASNTVFGGGNPKSQIMLIGEAPGKEEDRTGIPFVGQSGRLLDKMLASIGLDRDKCYISNVIPWRPPGNRTPTHIEVGLCLPFIQRHIELISPKIIVLLGGSSASALLAKNESVSNLRNKWHEYETPSLKSPIATLVTFHPAYLLRSPLEKRKSWQDLVNIAKKIEELNNSNI
ncbi:MAG: uracil-DNA glycosylase family protein [Alphaproteobacteria bacterium]